MEKKSFSTDDIIFREGDEGDVAYLVESGEIEISVQDGDASKAIGTVQETGLFGEMALISNMPRMATATAKGDATCVIIPRKVLSVLFRDSDPLLNALTFNLIGHIRSLNEQLNPKIFEEREVEFFFMANDGAYKRED